MNIARLAKSTRGMAFGVHRPSSFAGSTSDKEDGVKGFWYTKRVTLGNQRGLSLVELILATAIIGILSAIAVPLYAKKPIITRAAHEKVVADHGPVRGTTERTAPSADALGNVDERRATIAPASAPSPSRTHTSANAQERVDVWGPRTSRASSGSSFAVSGSTWRTSIQGKW